MENPNEVKDNQEKSIVDKNNVESKIKPSKTTPTSNYVRLHNPWWTEECAIFRKKRNNARRIAQRIRRSKAKTDEEKEEKFNEYRILRRECKFVMNQAKIAYNEKQLSKELEDIQI